MGRLLTWLLTAPILVVGLFAGHELGYRLAVPEPHAGGHALDEVGHGYFAYAPYAAAVLLSVAVVALGLRVRGALFGGRGEAPFFAFALLPPIGFALLEAVERLRGGELALSTMAAPEVIAGLTVQLPFALAALVVARLLCSLAHVVGVALRPFARPLLRPRVLGAAPIEADPAPLRVVALAYGERGPPFA